MVKIRTMPTTAPTYANREDVKQVVIPVFCRILRKLHLDELPQLFHVLEGKMSLVGPRPEMPQFHQSMDPEFARLRTSVIPGCTGLWQATDGIKDLHYVVPQYDRMYVANASLRLDFWIMWRTLMMLNPFAATKTLDDIPEWALRRQPQPVAKIITLHPESSRIDLRPIEQGDLAYDG
jgi:lipopolysaccharide/colanic/teichoic acid biosynthesis glycosyltransferase